MSTANASTEDLKDLLEESGGIGLVFGTDLFIASMPEEPDDCVCLYDTGGIAQGQHGFERPSVQVRLRSAEYRIGYDLIRDIKYYLHLNNGGVINGTRYISIEVKSEILFLGQDDKNRYLFTLNFQIHRSGI